MTDSTTTIERRAPLKAFACDEYELYAAESAEEAAAFHRILTGESPEDGYPRELTDAELDAPQPELDEDENPTGNMTSVRQMLVEHGSEPGWLAGGEW